MGDWRPTYPRPHLLLRCRRRFGAVVPFAVWLLCIAGTIALGRMLPQPALFSGIADSARTSVTAPVDGRISALLVTLHQDVEQGQVIARLDDRDVSLKLSQATFELERLRADMARRTADLEHEAATVSSEHGLETGIEQRRLSSAVESAQLAALTTRTELEEARVRVQGVTVEAERLTNLAAQGMVGEPELVSVRTERDALARRITELEGLQREHAARIAAAQQRAAAFAPGGIGALPVESTLAPMRWRLKEQQAALERIALDIGRLVLESPISGRVHAVMAQSGEWVPAGKALVAIVDPKPRRILAYVPDSVRGELGLQLPLTVVRGADTVLGTTGVQSISPTAVRMPEQLWLDPRREEWGYEVVLAATGREVPGERLQFIRAR
ncbi:MAG: biotin/lipoyl-binding protein [Planctomycetes bacterium]|nr:biotin/lipoyl-binding protein [Planctomycetota bacterium]